MKNAKFLVTSVAALLGSASVAAAVQLDFAANLTQLNDSGVSGNAMLRLDTDANTLDVSIDATGLVADQVHPQHIHGRFNEDGTPRDSVSPTDAVDLEENGGDGDGFVEIPEGATTYGPILIPLVTEAGGFLSPSDGILDYDRTFDLTDMGIFATDEDGNPLFDADDVLPLDLREIVLHGANVPLNAGAGSNFEVNGEQDEYVAGLPVASGAIEAVPGPAVVPLPAAGWMLIAGVGGLAAAARRKKRA